MPPKRRAPTRTPSQQATLAFHGSANKVTKSSARALQGKKNLLDKKTETVTKPETIDVSTDDEARTTTPEPPIVAQTPEEEAARAVPEKQINHYWKMRKGNDLRVHQAGLSVHEKILRDFDMTGQYGPCVGIDRSRRWKRAHRLRLNPPIEVLAVLIKEHEAGKKHVVERSRVDELLNAQYLELE